MNHSRQTPRNRLIASNSSASKNWTGQGPVSHTFQRCLGRCWEVPRWMWLWSQNLLIPSPSNKQKRKHRKMGRREERTAWKRMPRLSRAQGLRNSRQRLQKANLPAVSSFNSRSTNCFNTASHLDELCHSALLHLKFPTISLHHLPSTTNHGLAFILA